MSVSVSLVSQIVAQETLESGVDGAAEPVIIHSAFNATRTLNATSTTPATNVVCRELALVAGALTIDFTTITGTNGLVQNGTGKKVQIIRLKNTGAANMVITPGASNGLDLFGASFQFTLKPNQTLTFDFYDTGDDIASGDRTIDIAGTGTDTLETTVVMG